MGNINKHKHKSALKDLILKVWLLIDMVYKICLDVVLAQHRDVIGGVAQSQHKH